MTEKRVDLIMDMLEEGPVTAKDVSDDLGISMKNASARLSGLFQDGRLERKAIGEGRVEYLYYKKGTMR